MRRQLAIFFTFVGIASGHSAAQAQAQEGGDVRVTALCVRGSPAVRIELRWPGHAVGVMLVGRHLADALQAGGTVRLPRPAIVVCEDAACESVAGHVRLDEGASDREGQIMSGDLYWDPASRPSLRFVGLVTGTNRYCGPVPAVTAVRGSSLLMALTTPAIAPAPNNSQDSSL